MQFRTEIEDIQYPFRIKPTDKILTAGSCFAGVFGDFLKEHKLDCLSNPYGVIFNPVSLFRLFNQCLGKQPILRNLMVENQEKWYHYDFHSSYNHEDVTKLEQRLNLLHHRTGLFLKKTDYLIITLGTAFVYRLKKNDRIVANCHKQPASNFSKELLTQKEILARFALFYENLKLQNSRVKIIFTVSPVRHTKDTLQGNSLSKSTLRLIIDHIVKNYKDCFYFPSYEIMMDDLRDYRFYKEDMIHVNETGQRYVIDKFREAAISADGNAFLNKWISIKRDLSHRPFSQESADHQRFLKNLLEKLEQEKNEVNVEQEIEMVKAQLI